MQGVLDPFANKKGQLITAESEMTTRPPRGVPASGRVRVQADRVLSVVPVARALEGTNAAFFEDGKITKDSLCGRCASVPGGKGQIKNMQSKLIEALGKLHQYDGTARTEKWLAASTNCRRKPYGWGWLAGQGAPSIGQLSAPKSFNEWIDIAVVQWESGPAAGRKQALLLEARGGKVRRRVPQQGGKGLEGRVAPGLLEEGRSLPVRPRGAGSTEMVDSRGSRGSAAQTLANLPEGAGGFKLAAAAQAGAGSSSSSLGSLGGWQFRADH